MNLFYTILTIGVFIFCYFKVSRYLFALPRYYDEVHFVTTEDGWRLALHRYHPRGEARKNLPVVLCHGLGANRYNLDFGDRSLALYLSMRGYDVWICEKRGCGMSEGGNFFTRLRYGWDFDDLVKYDVPAVIEAVCRRSGSKRVQWVGHSEGGGVIYAYLQKPEASERIASAVALGSPGTFRFQPYLKPICYLGVFLGAPLVAMQATLAPLILPLIPLVFAIPGQLPVYPPNTDWKVICQALTNLVSNIPRGLIRQYMYWILNDVWVSADKAYDYEANFNKITAPIYFMAGSKDLLAPAKSLKLVFDNVSSSDKCFEVVGKTHGDRADYGHGDLAVGRHVNEDVFPKIEAWLSAHDG